MPRREGRSGGSGGWPSLLFFSPDNLVSSKPCTNYVGISYWILFCHFILHVSKVLCLVWVSLARLEGDVSPLSRIVIVWIAPLLMGPFFVCGGFSPYPSRAFLFAFQYDLVVLRVFVWYMCPFKQTNKKKRGVLCAVNLMQPFSGSYNKIVRVIPENSSKRWKCPLLVRRYKSVFLI